MVKYSNRGLSDDPSNLWLFGVLYWILYLSLEVWTQSILLGKFFLVERDYLHHSKQAIRYFMDRQGEINRSLIFGAQELLCCK